MSRLLSLTLLALLLSSRLTAQVLLAPDPTGLPDAFQLLRRPVFPLVDVHEAEALIELVNTHVEDLEVEKEFQRLRFPLSPLLQGMGLRWERLHHQKQRFIGTFSRHMKMYDGFAQEFDLNIFLVPHLDRYILLERAALDMTALRHRDFEEVKADTVPYPCPPELRHNGKCIAVECEVTPTHGAQEVLPETMLPIMSGTHDAVEHHSFGTSHPSMGVMGTWCADCNHNCRPEVHPIELMWWMSPGTRDSIVWNVVSFSDDSKRFPDWTGPVHATVDLPVLTDRDVTLTLKPALVHGNATLGDEEMRLTDLTASPGRKVRLRMPASLHGLSPARFSTRFFHREDGMSYLRVEFTSTDALAFKLLVQTH